MAFPSVCLCFKFLLPFSYGTPLIEFRSSLIPEQSLFKMLNLITSAKTHVPHKFALTDIEGWKLDLSFWKPQFNSLQKEFSMFLELMGKTLSTSPK